MNRDCNPMAAASGAVPPGVGGKRGGSRLLRLIIPLITGTMGFAVSFYLVFTGILPSPYKFIGTSVDRSNLMENWISPTFVVLDPIVVSLGPDATADHLRVTLALEVDPSAEEAVLEVKPRIVDILNIHLRTVHERDFEIPSMMMRIRAQLLQQVRMVTPPDSVRSVLLQEFLLN